MDVNNKLREMVISKMMHGEYEVKPCPFCGGEVDIMTKENFEYLQERTGTGHACISIECNNCNLDFYDFTTDEANYFIRKALVLDKWNRRANNVCM